MDKITMEKLYQLLHTFDEKNIALALQLAEGQGYREFLEYWDSIKTAMDEIMYYNDYLALQSEDDLIENLSKNLLIISSSKIAPTACNLHKILRHLEFFDSQVWNEEAPHEDTSIDLFHLIEKLPLLESLHWSSLLGIVISSEIKPKTSLTKLILSGESIYIPTLTIFPNLKTLQLISPNIVVEQGSFELDNLWIENDESEKYPDWLLLFQNIKTLILKDLNYKTNEEILLKIPHLQSLHIQNNSNLFYLPPCFLQLSQLEKLRIEACGSFNDFDALQNLKQLKTLNLKDTLHDGKYASCDRFNQVVDNLQKALPNTKIELE